MLEEEVKDLEESRAEDATRQLVSFLKEDEVVGDLLSLDYSEATVLVHDSLRKTVGGLPMGCFLLATRLTVDDTPMPNDEDTALLLLRVTGHAPLPNKSDTENWRFDAALRSIDSPEHWDADKKSDQFTRNLLRHAGVCCKVLGTFRYVESSDRWVLNFGADISNFYSGQGMKVFKPMGAALANIVNFSKPTGSSHPLSGRPVKIGRVRYAATEIEINEEREHVEVSIEPTDMLARRTALFGMSRSGKSNTIKTLATALFKLRTTSPEKGRVGQLIFDVNGEYCNDNPQDEGCLRNISESEVVTYGLFEHPYDPERRLIKLNFWGEPITTWEDKNSVELSLAQLVAGKTVIGGHLQEVADSQYIKNFVHTEVLPSTSDWSMGDQIRCQRNLAVYRTVLAAANYDPPQSLSVCSIRGLFHKDLRNAMKATEDTKIINAAEILDKDTVSWDALSSALKILRGFISGGRNGEGDPKYKKFNTQYVQVKGKNWHDDTLKGLLSIFEYPGGIAKIREIKERHSPKIDDDYSTKIVDELTEGKLVIVDQSIGSPKEIEVSSERIMWELFNREKDIFTNPKRDSNNELLRDESGSILPPPDVIAYVEEAHNLLPSQNADLSSIWARVAKEGSKFRIGLVYSTQEPSSILSNILKNTDN